MNNYQTSEEKKKVKEEKLISKFSKKKKLDYLSKGILNKKFKNSQVFTNAKDVSDNGNITSR